MGIKLVIAVLTLAARHRLTQRELLVLATMAVTALDTPNGKGQPAGLYFAGWEHLAIHLGMEPSAKAKEQIRRILQRLRSKGLIEGLEDHPRAGRRQTYKLRLDSVDTLLPLDVRDHPQVAPAGNTAEVALWDHLQVGEGTTPKWAPRSTQEEGRTYLEESTHPSASTTDRARIEFDPEQPHVFLPDGIWGDTCEHCGLKQLNVRHSVRRTA